MDEKKRVRGQGGFTLIEIIAVLVILGILAVTAIPKYNDMQTEARKQVLQGLIAAAQGQLSIDYAKSLLDTTATFAGTCTNVTISDSTNYSLSCSGDKTGVTITATYGSGTDAVSLTGAWKAE